MLHRGVCILSEILAHPADAFTAHDMIGVDHVFQPGNRGHVPVHHDLRLWREPADHGAHLPDLANIYDDGGYAHDIVAMLCELTLESLAGRKIEHCTRRGNVFLDHHDPPGAMKHAQ